MPPVIPDKDVMSLLAPFRAKGAPAAVLDPVPPLAMFSTPERVMAPVVATLGLNPVVPAEKLVTAPLEREAQVGAVDPFEVSICPVVPAAVNLTSVPSPYATPPAVGVPIVVMRLYAVWFRW